MTEHYFTGGGDLTGLTDISFSVWDYDLTMTTAAGVFSADGLDHATRVLLERTPRPQPESTLLDLGCGWGPIACVLALAEPKAAVWAVDVNPHACELTRRNAKHLGVTVNVATPDNVPGDLTFDAIWSNPPIRIGKAALHELLLTWLPRLKPTGVAHLVVGKNLGADSLQRWLIEHGWNTERIASAKGFRVLRVRRT